MDFYERDGKSWLWLRREINDLSDLVNNSILFSDLDDTHVKSPAKQFAYKRIGTSIFDIQFINWALFHGSIAKFNKKKETEAWFSYVDSFLRGNDDIILLYLQKKGESLIYPYVRKFLKLFPKKIYVSRNIDIVLDFYSNIFDIDSYFSEIRDKGKLLDSYFMNYSKQIFSSNKIIFIEGDSQEDEEMLNVAKFYSQKYGGKVIGIYVGIINKNFDICTSKNRKLLVKKILYS